MDCKLRPWRPDDAAQLAAILNNKSILDSLRDGIPFPYTLDDAKAFIAARLSGDKDLSFPFAIVRHDQVIGSIGASRLSNIHFRSAEMGYYVAQPLWGQGIATCAVRQLCAHIFENTDIIRIFAEPFARNIASCRVLEKAGFQYEGTLRANAVKKGEVLDMKMYALIRA
ncbi:MAG: GNAT family N-acetyltransferase [Christensenellales bacterium]